MYKDLGKEISDRRKKLEEAKTEVEIWEANTEFNDLAKLREDSLTHKKYRRREKLNKLLR
jgi:hypothetical protein